MKDFRPISFIVSILKLIAKSLDGKLNKVINSGEVQKVLAEGCQIFFLISDRKRGY